MMKDWLDHRAGMVVSSFGNGINLSQSLHDVLRSQKDERLFIVDFKFENPSIYNLILAIAEIKQKIIL
jgi:hypothetical protein